MTELGLKIQRLLWRLWDRFLYQEKEEPIERWEGEGGCIPSIPRCNACGEYDCSLHQDFDG